MQSSHLAPTDLHAQSHPTSSRATPPASPTPFMRTFNASAQPPAHAILSESEPVRPSRWWPTDVNKFRRAHTILALLLAFSFLLFVAGTSSVLYSSSILLQDSPSQADLHFRHPAVHHHRKRQDTSESQTRAGTTFEIEDPGFLTNGDSSVTRSTTGSTTPSGTVPPVPSESPPLPTPFLQPFDASLTYDFASASCQTFFDTLTQDKDFRSCRPFGLLLSSSEAFLRLQNPNGDSDVDADGNKITPLEKLTNVLWGTCNTVPSAQTCIDRMSQYEQRIQTECSQELSSNHAITSTLLNGFRNYAMTREVGCLRNLRTNSYCFADAVAATPPSDIYFYHLPLGTPLPGIGTPAGVRIKPSCSPCVQSVMGVYAQYVNGVNGTDSTDLLIDKTYSSAANVLKDSCGVDYAQVISLSGALGVRSPVSTAGVVISALLAVLLGIWSL